MFTGQLLVSKIEATVSVWASSSKTAFKVRNSSPTQNLTYRLGSFQIKGPYLYIITLFSKLLAVNAGNGIILYFDLYEKYLCLYESISVMLGVFQH